MSSNGFEKVEILERMIALRHNLVDTRLANGVKLSVWWPCQKMGNGKDVHINVNTLAGREGYN